MPFSNPIKAREYAKIWARKRRKTHPISKEKQYEYWRNTYTKNTEKIKKRAKDFRSSHLEEVRNRERDYSKNNRHIRNKNNKLYCLRNPERVKIQKTKNQSARRARLAGCITNKTADIFYKFVRSKEKIKCYYCGIEMSGKEAHIDHVIAISKNGNHSSENLAASCANCNLRKNSKLPSEIYNEGQPLLNL